MKVAAASRIAAIAMAMLLLWQGSEAREPAAGAARRGIVHGDRHAFVDVGGPFLARGASLFWGLWGYQHDRARLARNLATLRDWGFDYIRVLGVVGSPGQSDGDSWHDRRLDPTAASYDRDVAGFTDWVYQEYGLRVQWTIFGGTDFTPTPELRRALVERFGSMSGGREQEILAFEVANEAWQNGFPGQNGRAELHALARLLKAKSRVLVALSAPEGSSCEAARALYRDSPADLMTLHLARAGAGGGAVWQTFDQPWSLRTCRDVPTLVSSNEPIGPESSVASLDDPATLAALAAVTYGSGIGAFVLHTGPGVRGGGAADRARGRHSNVWELPTGAAIARSLSALNAAVPGDFANWEKLESQAPSRPFDVADGAGLAGNYCFSSRARFACLAFGIRQPVRLIARRPLTAFVRDFSTMAASGERHLVAGDHLELQVTPPVRLVIGSE